jgi:hypothetical protein
MQCLDCCDRVDNVLQDLLADHDVERLTNPGGAAQIESRVMQACIALPGEVCTQGPAHFDGTVSFRWQGRYPSLDLAIHHLSDPLSLSRGAVSEHEHAVADRLRGAIPPPPQYVHVRTPLRAMRRSFPSDLGSFRITTRGS